MAAGRHDQALAFGLLIGAMWAAEIVVGNLGDTPLLGSLRTVHPQLYRTAGAAFAASALAATFAAGAWGAPGGRWRDGLRAAAIAGLGGGAIALVTLVGLTLALGDALAAAPSNVAEYALSHPTAQPTPERVRRWLLGDAAAAGASHLVIGLVSGAVLGGIGAAISRRGAAPRR
jgi:hypothetical protein